MCLDIDRESVIHKHLVKKFKNACHGSYYSWTDKAKWNLPSQLPEVSEHSLTMLPSFHISLGAPPPNSTIKKHKLDIPIVEDHLHQLIGGIALADIHVSEYIKIKKSAFIKLPKFIIPRLIIPEYFGFGLINEGFEELINNKHEYHISLANLTGNPHDSIARPEDCIIDTITA